MAKKEEIIKKIYTDPAGFGSVINTDGSDYVLETGRGAPLTEIVQQVEPTVEFNDVKNDPYFVVK